MVPNDDQKRPVGRPRGFEPEVALDQAVRMFWVNGYEGVDVDRIARAVGVSKPALYREFQDKSTLLVKAVKRYAETSGLPAMLAFQGEPEIAKAVRAFCEATIETATSEEGQTGCLMACSVVGQSERVEEIREFFLQTLEASAEFLGQRFEMEMKEGHLSQTVPAKVRGRMLIALMQAMALHARAGVPRVQLLEETLSYLPLVLS